LVLTRFFLCAVLTLAVALGIAACGGGGDTTSTTTSTTRTSTTSTSTTSTTASTDPDSAASDALGVTVTTASAGEPGVVVQAVPADSKIRLRVGDVIVSLNGKPVTSTEELAGQLGHPGLGESFTLEVVRGSHRFSLEVVPSPTAYLGTEIKTQGGGDGVAVLAIAPGGPAAKAGLKAGDVIVAIDGTATKSSDALLTELAAHAPGDTVELTVKRNGDQLKLTATLGEHPTPGG
jgi:putative serine protease PepD